MELENNAGFVTKDELSTELRSLEKDVREELKDANERILIIERQLQLVLKSQKVADLRNQRLERERLDSMTTSERLDKFGSRISANDQKLLSLAGVRGGNKTRRWRSKKTRRRFTRSKI